MNEEKNMLIVSIGMLFCSIGLFFIFLYTNLLTIGYSFFDFVQFISTRFECILFVIGLIMIIVSIEKRRKNVLLLRRSFEFQRRK